MAILTVNTLSDVVDANDGKLSLREAITQANSTAAADTIQFASALEGQTLTLTGGELVLRQDVTIDGDQNNDGVGVTLSGGDTQRILRTAGPGTDLSLDDLGLTHGYAKNGRGGAIFVDGGTLSVSSCSLSHNRTYSSDGSAIRTDGGAIYAAAGSRVVIEDSSLVDNHIGGFFFGGGAIATDDNVSLIIHRSELSANSTATGGEGGALLIRNGGTLVVEDSVISGNSAGGFQDYAFDGGGIILYNARITIIRSSLLENSSNDGGAIAAFDSYLSIADSTSANNTVGMLSILQEAEDLPYLGPI